MHRWPTVSIFFLKVRFLANHSTSIRQSNTLFCCCCCLSTLLPHSAGQVEFSRGVVSFVIQENQVGQSWWSSRSLSLGADTAPSRARAPMRSVPCCNSPGGGVRRGLVLRWFEMTSPCRGNWPLFNFENPCLILILSLSSSCLEWKDNYYHNRTEGNSGSSSEFTNTCLVLLLLWERLRNR